MTWMHNLWVPLCILLVCERDRMIIDRIDNQQSREILLKEYTEEVNAKDITADLRHQ